MLENRMVIDSEWAILEDDATGKLNGPGYKEATTGNFVPEEDAYDYASEKISQDEDLKQEFVDWFFRFGWDWEDGGYE